MKNKFFIRACVGLSILLSGCFKNSSTQETLISTIDPDTESESFVIPEEFQENLAKFYAGLETGVGTLETENYATTYFFGYDAVYNKYSDSKGDGYIVNKNQGTYPFVVNNNGIVYGDILDRSTDGATLREHHYTLFDIFEIGSDIWKYSSQGFYTSFNDEIFDIFTTLYGSRQPFGKFVFRNKLYFDEDDVIIEYELLESAFRDNVPDDGVYKMRFKDFNNTHEALIEQEIENPTHQDGLSKGYNNSLKDDLKEYSGIDFPNLNLSSESYSEFTEGKQSLVLRDLSNDHNKINDIINTLSEVGYSVMEDTVETWYGINDDGSGILWDPSKGAPYYSTATLTRKSFEDDGSVLDYYVVLNYDSVGKLDGFYRDPENQYPNGLLSIELFKIGTYTYENVCDDLMSLVFPDNFKIDSFGFDNSPISSSIGVYDLLANEYSLIKYFHFYVCEFEDAVDLFSELDCTELYLTSLGFVSEPGSTVNDLKLGFADEFIISKTFSDHTTLELCFNISDANEIAIYLMY